MVFTHKQFTCSVLAMTVLLFAAYSYVILNFKMYYMNFDYPSWEHVSEYVDKTSQEKFNVVALGDSRTKSSFIPHDFDDERFNSINLALSGTSPIEGYYTLKKYLIHNAKPDYILIGYAPPMLTNPYFYLNTVKFRFLEDEEYEEIERLAVELDDNKIIGAVDYLDYKYYTGKYISDFINGITEMRWNVNMMSEKMLRESKGHQFSATGNGSTDPSRESQQDGFVSSALVKEYFIRLLDLANDNGIETYWFTNPITQISVDALPEGYEKAYHSYLETLSNEHRVIILSGINTMAPEKFGDRDHLYTGAEEFTAQLKQQLLERLGQ